MDAVPWWDILKTGHAAMDADHRTLVELVNRLAEGIRDRKGKEFFDKALDDVIHNTKAHFEREEKLMAERHYPKAAQHAQEHAALIQRVLDYGIKFEADAESSYAALIHFAEVWLCHHILFADKELAGFLAGDGGLHKQRS